MRSYPCDPPPLGIILIISQPHGRIILKSRAWKDGRDRRSVLAVGTQELRLLIHNHGHVETHSVCRIPHALHIQLQGMFFFSLFWGV